MQTYIYILISITFVVALINLYLNLTRKTCCAGKEKFWYSPENITLKSDNVDQCKKNCLFTNPTIEEGLGYCLNNCDNQYSNVPLRFQNIDKSKITI
jgi:hypothetical protein